MSRRALTPRYADVTGNRTDNGSAVNMWTYTGFANQRWTLVRV